MTYERELNKSVFLIHAYDWASLCAVHTLHLFESSVREGGHCLCSSGFNRRILFDLA